MASGASPRTLPQQGTRTSFGGYSGANAAHLLERSRAGLRGSTPDSEALASSDDEQDQLHRLQKVTSNPVSKPGRRASWLTEQSNSTRNVSMGAGPFSPISPGAANPSSENIPWGSHATQNPPPATGRGHSSSASFPWSNTIWNTDTPKGPPQRLAEVIPSPTTVGPPGSAGVYGDEGLVSPRDMSNDQSIPFAIPLQPTPKTYRSQSYSVGQLDPDAPKPPATNFTAHNPYVRGRIGSSYAGLSHRPSRPSMLGDGAHDPQQLGQLREVDDDNESLDLSDPGLHQASDPARTIEHLARENAMLRQQAAESRERAAIGQLPLSSPQHMSLRNRRSSKGAMSEGSDQAVFDAEDGEAHKMYKKDGSTGRRFSEFGANATPNYPFTNLPEHRTMETIKKGQWQSSLGFGGIGEPPQSRRHSFAEVPTRQNSTTTGSEVHSPRDIGDRGSPANMKPMSPGVYNDGLARPPQGEVNYFSRMDPSLRGGGDEFRSPSSTTLHSAYAQGPFGRGQQYGINHTRPKQLLYLVTFKCQRADVFYIQENTGLRVHKGDLVIVEADRGTDLGTVASDCVAWAEAKEAKDRFIEEHHRWLMMFSQHGQNGTVASHNPNGPPQSATLGPGTGQSGISDVPSGELKPKMIKRVAQPHEIQALREKEGAEAKAKRACQQKVIEHRLRMEILDAEFQMDWKKLTFFYFADSYINFNPLVTDLFKIYKTRIWMSAINTAAIATPAPGQHLLGGPAHRNYSPELDEYAGRHQPGRNPQSPAVASPSEQFAGNDQQLWNPGQSFSAMPPGALNPYYGPIMPGSGFDTRHLMMGPYTQPTGNMQGFFGPADYGASVAQTNPPVSSQPEQRASNPRERHDMNDKWNEAFSRLSMNH